MTRIRDIDVLRGFAVCGIMLVNTWQHTAGAIENRVQSLPDWLVENLAQSRFYPIFSFLFGVGVVLFLRSAAHRTPRPWIPLLRRLAVLAAFGLVHRLVNPGEVLLPYALTGALALLPASFLPRWAVLAAGTGATLWAVLFKAGGVWLIPGLALLGMAVMLYAPPPRALRPVFLAAATSAGALVVAWAYLWARPETFEFRFTVAVYPLAGLAAATAYCAGVLLWLRHRPGSLAVLESLGRMALTMYLSGTVIILAVLPLLVTDPTRASVFVMAAVALAAQAAFARWWLARYRYGPLEWVWRCVTWWEPVPNRIPVHRTAEDLGG
ncbi:DUF418 domain-containing protein [Sphaerisporangium aureirubrum]|uniref:DUF418 domain-containing protein n=1 Tax=Sphaerisporangium aureirubrum TaxID=1544736 RepID=A0ABW1NSU4_9ACTN